MKKNIVTIFSLVALTALSSSAFSAPIGFSFTGALNYEPVPGDFFPGGPGFGTIVYDSDSGTGYGVDQDVAWWPGSGYELFGYDEVSCQTVCEGWGLRNISLQNVGGNNIRLTADFDFDAYAHVSKTAFAYITLADNGDGSYTVTPLDYYDEGWIEWQLGGTLVPVSDVPIPSAIWLFGAGLLGLLGAARRNSSERY